MNKLLKGCEEIEQTIAAIYRQLAETVACAGELQAIWTAMAKDEDDHAAQIRLANRLPESETVEQLKLPEAKVNQLLNRARTILEGARTTTMSADDALRVSLKLEGEFLAVHTALAIEFADESMRRMFQCLARCDEEHQRDLREYHARHFAQTPARSAVGAD